MRSTGSRMSPRRFGIFFVALVLFLGVGCVVKPPKKATVPSNIPLERPTSRRVWQDVADGAARFSYDVNATTTAVLYRFSPDRFEIGLAAENQPKRVSAWRDDLSDARLIVNGSYFDADGSPSGYLAIDGRRIGKRAFDLDKSGFVRVGTPFDILDTSRVPVDLNATREGFQSYPFFFIDGHPAIKRDSGFQARRTFIGTDKDGMIYVGVIADGEISLYATMQALASTGVRWNNVLNLDGGPSTGLATRFEEANETMDSFTPVPNVLVVREKNERGRETP